MVIKLNFLSNNSTITLAKCSDIDS